MKEFPQNPEGQFEREKRPESIVTAYIIRYGETTENKLDPKRGLTPRGEQQVVAAAERLKTELDPETDLIQIFDSGNFRANATVMRIATKLKEAGFNFFEPIELDTQTLQSKRAGVKTTTEPKSRKYERLEAAKIPDDFKKQLADPELHKRLGIPEQIKDKRIATWYLGEWPEEVEKPTEVAARVEKGIANTQKQILLLTKQLGPDKRIVVIAAANASALDAIITQKTKLSPVDRMGEIENCEGFKVGFCLGQEPKFSVWGKEIEHKVKEK